MLTSEVSLLPIGHNNKDIDHASSCSFERLHSNDAPMLYDIHQILRTKYGGHTPVIHLTSIMNSSGLRNLERVLRYVTPFSQYRFFSFSHNSIVTALARLTEAICNAKTNSKIHRKLMYAQKFASVLGFLNWYPKLWIHRYPQYLSHQERKRSRKDFNQNR